jgi:hypothetical protein
MRNLAKIASLVTLLACDAEYPALAIGNCAAWTEDNVVDLTKVVLLSKSENTIRFIFEGQGSMIYTSDFDWPTLLAEWKRCRSQPDD